MMTTEEFRKEYFAINMMRFALRYATESKLLNNEHKWDVVGHEIEDSLTQQNKALHDRAITPYGYAETWDKWLVTDEFKELEEQALNLTRKYRDQANQRINAYKLLNPDPVSIDDMDSTMEKISALGNKLRRQLGADSNE